MKRYLKLTLVLVAIFGLTAVAYGQLAGTQRLNEHHWFISDRCTKFGNTPNASICYTGGNLVLDILAGGGKVSIPDGLDLGTGNLSTSTSVIFEGATADAFETTLTVTDPTADNTVTIPNQSGTVILSAGGIPESVNAIWGGAGTLIFEGTTANDFETTLFVNDPTADRTLRLPDVGGTLLITNGAMSDGTVNNSVIGGTVPAAGTFTTLSATTSITSSAPGTLGWSIVAAANQACTTTCTSACVHGWDTAAGEVAVDCANAIADKCLCAGAN
jgi:hypothetical protein